MRERDKVGEIMSSEQIKIMKGDIFQLKKSTDLAVFRSNKVTDITLETSRHFNSNFCYILPEIELNEDNTIEFLELYYKKAIWRGRERNFKTIAISVPDLGNEELNFSFAVEFHSVLKTALKFTRIEVTLVCENKELRDIYEMAIYGDVRSSQFTMADKLEPNEVILIPTQRNILKFDRNYKILKDIEPRKVFLPCYLHLHLNPGQYFLTEKDGGNGCYFFLNLIKGKKDKKITQDEFNRLALNGVKNVLDVMKSMCCKDITFPIINFIKDKKENEQFVRKIIDTIFKFVKENEDEYEINVKFYCPDIELWNLVVECFEEKMGNKEE